MQYEIDIESLYNVDTNVSWKPSQNLDALCVLRFAM